MRRSSFLSTTALASALLLGCSDQPVGTDPKPDATPPLMAAVSRVEAPLSIFFGQEAPPLAAVLGVTVEELPAWCAGTFEGQPVTTMTVTHPTQQGGISEVLLTKATDLIALVWLVDVAAPGGDICDPALQPFVGTVHGPAFDAMAAAMRDVYGRDVSLQGSGGSIPLCNVFQETFPNAEIMLLGVEEPSCLIHAPNESVSPTEIENMAIVEALFLQRCASD